MNTQMSAKIPLKLFKKINKEYEEKFSVDPLSPTRRRENVISRHCLGLVLTNKFRMGPTEVSRLIGCDHSNVVYSNKKVKEQIEIMNADYIQAVNNWREVFNDNSKEIAEQTTTRGMIRERLSGTLQDALIDGLVDGNDIGNMLIDLLRKYAPEFVSEDQD